MIGVFDSGFGGLSILKEVVKMMPQYEYVYLGDTARTPYGSRSSEVVCGFTEQAIDFLLAKDCELILVACNTASAEALRTLQTHYLKKGVLPERKLLGVIVPAVEEAVKVSKTGRIGVLATTGTVTSKAFEREILQRRPESQVFEVAAPLLVPLIEEGEHQSPAMTFYLEQYLMPLRQAEVDTVVLGCTHYGHVVQQVEIIMGPDVKIIAEGPVVAQKLVEYLKQHTEIKLTTKEPGAVHFYSTDSGDRFARLGELFYGAPLIAHKISFN